jgi:plasmid stabilization system protein ParE
MTNRVFRSSRAAAEIDKIAAFLTEQSPRAAQRFEDALKRAYQILSEFPNAGPPGLRPGTRRLIVGSYIVSHRRRGNDVEIFAVRHASRGDARF